MTLNLCQEKKKKKIIGSKYYLDVIVYPYKVWSITDIATAIAIHINFVYKISQFCSCAKSGHLKRCAISNAMK